MKPYTKFTLGLLFVGVIGIPLVMKGPDGKPIMRLNDWLPSASNDFGQQLKSAVNSTVEHLPGADDRYVDSLSASSGKMYKWQDDKGRWHFSSEKPRDNTQVAVENIPDLQNVMEPTVVSDDNSSTIDTSSSNALPSGFPTGPLSISMDQAGELLKQVEQISKDAEERKTVLEGL